jgi:hypothetical protein
MLGKRNRANLDCMFRYYQYLLVEMHGCREKKGKETSKK